MCNFGSTHTNNFTLFMLEECFVCYKLVKKLHKAYDNISCFSSSCQFFKLRANFISKHEK